MTDVKLALRGLRGESSTDVARRTGAFGVLSTDTDQQALAKMSDATYGPEIITARGADANLGARVDRIDNKLRIGANLSAGPEAGDSLTTATFGVYLGERAARDTTSATGGIDLGYAAGQGNLTGNYGVRIGFAAGLTAPDADRTVAVGGLALYGAHGDGCVAVGYEAAVNYTGTEITAVGDQALKGVTGGANLTAVGAASGSGATGGGGNNSFFGHNAGGGAISQFAAGQNMTALGSSARCTQTNQVSLGNTLVEDVLACGTVMYRAYPTPRTYFLAGAGSRQTGNFGTVGIGEAALSLATATHNCVAIGDLALQNNTASNGLTAVGARAMNASINCIDTTMVGNRAGASMTTGVGATGIGFRVLEFATESRDATGVGDSALWLYQGHGATAVGYRAAEYTTGGDAGVYVGRATGVNRLDGERCVFVGSEAGGFYNVTPDPVTGVGAVAAGDRVVGVGYRALALTTGDDHTAVGDNAGVSLTGGSGSVFLGASAGNNASQKVNAANAIAIGKDAFTTADNQVVLGNSSISQTALRGKVGIGLGLTVPSANLHVNCTSGDESPLITRDVTEDALVTNLRLKTVRATNMGDNIGAGVYFQIVDDAAVTNSIGVVGAIRKGADNTGEIQARPFTAGVLAEGMVVRDRQAIVGWATAMPAGGIAGVGYCMSSTANFGVFFGSGAPTLAAAKGSLYMRSDGTGVNDRMYVNTDGATNWTAVVTVA